MLQSLANHHPGYGSGNDYQTYGGGGGGGGFYTGSQAGGGSQTTPGSEAKV